MKDAKGHGSDAHGSGVAQIGQPKEYAWIAVPHGGGHILAHDGNYADQVGSVRPQTQANGKRQYVGSYNYSQSTGNAPSGYSHHGSVQGAKRYVEGNLAKFWKPPNVRQG